MNEARLFDAVVIGVSAGGLAALDAIIPELSSDIPAPVFVVQHLSPNSDSYIAGHLDKRSRVIVEEAEDKVEPVNGHVYFAPPNYHLLIECNRTMLLSTDGKVNFSRPSVDVLFETAAEVYADRLIGIILTGANSDGAKGLLKIQRFGGMTIVQSPETAEADAMPKAALEKVEVDHVLPLEGIGGFVNKLLMGKDAE